MKTSIARQLIGINRCFYDGFARSWATSRVAIHKGILKSMDELRPMGHILDLGCGDGRVGRWVLENRERMGLSSYVGADYSAELLQHAQSEPGDISFVCADMTSPAWKESIAQKRALFDNVVCFSALHHIPGPRRRLRVMRDIYELTRPGGKCVISVWQLSHVPRLEKKIVPWSTAGLNASDLEYNDLLVDWKMGGAGLRYVHEFNLQELKHTCLLAGFKLERSFRSDGQTGDMGLYVVLEKPTPPQR